MNYKVSLRNVATGQVVEVDNHKSRMARMRKRIKAWSDLVERIEVKKSVRFVMIRLSYDTEGTLVEASDWEANHIRDYVKELKRRLGERLLAMAWVAEMQKRGVPHYHLYIMVFQGTRIPMPDEGMWPHGSSRIATGRSPYYLVSYLKTKDGEKVYQKIGFPKGMRIFSVWVRKGLTVDWNYTLFRWSALPGWLNEELCRWGFWFVNMFPRPMEGGGWQIELSEERRKLIDWPTRKMEFVSPWVVC